MMETIETDERGRMSKARSHSFSGHEPNYFFQNLGGTDFRDLSGLSGLDSRADSRSFAMLDFDRDGWLDVALVNANAPQLNLFQNRISQLVSEPRHVIAVRLVGGNTDGRARSDWSNRDAIGAQVHLTANGTRISRELRAGDGFAAQNSNTLVIGIGTAPFAENLTVRWPSGRTHEIPSVPAGSLLTIFENPAGEAVIREPYLKQVALPAPNPARAVLKIPGVSDSGARIRVATTFETWCPTCKGELPHFERLRTLFRATDVEFFGLPTDPEDTVPVLKQFVAEHDPAYAIIGALQAPDRLSVRSYFESELKTFVLPSTVVLNRENEVLQVYRGVPTVSDLRRHLAEN